MKYLEILCEINYKILNITVIIIYLSVYYFIVFLYCLTYNTQYKDQITYCSINCCIPALSFIGKTLSLCNTHYHDYSALSVCLSKSHKYLMVLKSNSSWSNKKIGVIHSLQKKLFIKQQKC